MQSISESIQREELLRFIKEEFKSGNSADSIVRHLLQKGYPFEHLNKISYYLADEHFVNFRQVLNTFHMHNSINSQKHRLKKTVHRKFSFIRLFSGLGLFGLFGFMIWVQINSKTDLFRIILAFSPSFFSYLLIIFILEKYGKKYFSYCWSVPFLFIGVFIVLGTQTKSPLLANMDILELSAINLIVSLTFLGLMEFTGITDTSHRKVIEKQVIIMPQKSIQDYIQTIEDKSKAINFVIGRVYSDKHGGSSEIRSLIKIEKEWYNEITNSKGDNRIIKECVNKIQKRLILLTKTEYVVFGDKISSLKTIKRKNNGSERIIDVLKLNDKDPVMTYFESAIQFCDNVIIKLV